MILMVYITAILFCMINFAGNCMFLYNLAYKHTDIHTWPTEKILQLSSHPHQHV